MKGIVWGSTLEKAKKKLKQIEKDYEMHKTANLISKKDSKYGYELFYDNGDCWRAISARENMRGCRCNISYVDTEIEDCYVKEIIYHSTSALPFQAFTYY